LTTEENKKVVVTSSGMSMGEPDLFISRGNDQCWTQNKPFSWFCVDLGEDVQLIPTQYSMGYASSGSACSPRNWVLQGSNQPPDLLRIYNETDPPNQDPDWQNLTVHQNDLSLSSDWAMHSWRVNCRSSYRYFRVVQTKINAQANAMSQVLVANRFELYGTLLSKNVGVVNGPPAEPRKYGSPQAQPPPEYIRAHPDRQREIVELLEVMMQLSQGQVKAERVRVHDIIIEE